MLTVGVGVAGEGDLSVLFGALIVDEVSRLLLVSSLLPSSALSVSSRFCAEARAFNEPSGRGGALRFLGCWGIQSCQLYLMIRRKKLINYVKTMVHRDN